MGFVLRPLQTRLGSEMNERVKVFSEEELLNKLKLLKCLNILIIRVLVTLELIKVVILISLYEY